MSQRQDINDFTDAEIKEEAELRGIVTGEPDIDDFTDREVLEAYQARGLKDVFPDANIDRLAEMIVSGANDAALTLLCDLYPGLHPAAIRNVVASRGAYEGRLF